MKTELNMDSGCITVVTLCLLLPCALGECVFPYSFLDHQWYYRISPQRSTRTKVIFGENRVRFEEQQLPSDNILSSSTLTCEEMVDSHTFVLKEINNDNTESYKCVEFVIRGQSIMQIKESAVYDHRDRHLCEKNRLTLRPWLIVSYSLMRQEFTPCRINGGYNMKIKNHFDQDHGCNNMDHPMRYESDCMAGEGVIFDFRKKECTGMMTNNIVQRATCVTHWYHGDYLYSIVRKVKTGNVWCIRYPRNMKSDNVEVIVYDDVICPDDSFPNTEDIFFFKLQLHRTIHTDLCADEYEQCSAMSFPCMPYIKEQCHRSCKTCDINESPAICSFPRRFRGSWYLSNSIGTEAVNISDHSVQIGSIGNFKCISLPGSPLKSKRRYTTVSMFSNGCRPRYTCVNFKRLGPAVIGFSVSQSLRWPLNLESPGETLCSESNFKPDPVPIFDTYRSLVNALKPILPVTRKHKPVPCNLDTSYGFFTNIPNRGSCTGKLYSDCKEKSLIKFEFNKCRSHSDDLIYACVATYKGRYWERLILLQNIYDSFDSKCLAFSEVNEYSAILLPSSQCDMNSWSYVDNGIRVPTMRLRITEEDVPCRAIKQTTTTSTTTTTTTTTTTSPPFLSEAYQMKTNESKSSQIQLDSSLMRDGQTLNDGSSLYERGTHTPKKDKGSKVYVKTGDKNLGTSINVIRVNHIVMVIISYISYILLVGKST